jgi:hypothetical protein
MRSTPASPRHIQVFLFLFVLSGCRNTESRGVSAVDLIHDFDRAEKRPTSAQFQIGNRQADGVTHPSIIVPVPSRVTWSLRIPGRASFQAAVALAGPPPGGTPAPIRLRVGINDRTFENLSEVTLTPGDTSWMQLRADLSDYGGPKWSLFYRPDRITWRLQLSADAVGGAPAVALWGKPEIVVDTR